MAANSIRAGRAFVELALKDKLGAGLKKAGKKLLAFGNMLTSSALKFTAITSAAFAPLAGAALVFSRMGDEMAKASDRTGVQVEALSELAYAADQSGTSLSGLETGLKKSAKLMHEAKDGSKEAHKTISRLGLSVAQLEKMRPDQRFEAFADAISRIKDPGERAAMAMEVFGKSGTELLPLMKEGAAGIQALRKRAQELGLVMGTDDARAAEEFGDRLDDLWKQTKMVTFHIGAAVATALLPYAQTVHKALAVVVNFVKEHRGWVITIAAVLAGVFALGAGLVTLGVLISSAGVVLTTVGAASTVNEKT
jgi:hypothetical protein